MIALKKANYLGRVDYFKQENGIIASVTSYPDTDYAENLHYHDTLHMSFILRGGNLEKRTQKDIDRLPGTVTFYDAGEPHRSTRILPGSRHVNLEITDALIEQHGLSAGAALLEALKKPGAKFLMMKAYKELLWNDQDSALGIETAVLHLLHLAARQYKAVVQPAWVNKIYELLQDRWNEPLSLHELSVTAQLHPCNLSAWFTKYFGCTIGEYRRKLKIEMAVSLIAADTYSLTEIAYICGFADQSHFTRVFKELTGWAPKPYEKLNR